MKIRHDVPGRELTTLEVGGLCRTVIDVASEAGLLHALGDYPDAIAVGGGSNLIIADNGFSGTIIRIFSAGARGIEVQPNSGLVKAEAPVEWDTLVRVTIEHDFAGLEATSGVPGSVGGAIVQNLGAYGQETADVAVSVNAWDRSEQRLVTLSREQCAFAYRTSMFKHDTSRRYVVTSALMQFTREAHATPRYGDVSELLAERFQSPGPYLLADIRNAVIAVRRNKGMLVGLHRSAGSFFTNPAVTEEQASALSAQGFRIHQRADGVRLASAAALLEASGFSRGYKEGEVGLSDEHVLALVNLGAATAREILSLAAKMKTAVHQRFGVWLTPEPVLIGFENDPIIVS